MTQLHQTTSPTQVPTQTPAPRRPATFLRTAAHWSTYIYRLIAAEISAAARYYDRLFQVEPLPFDSGFLLEAIDCADKHAVADAAALPDLRHERDQRTAVLLNGNFNHHFDIHEVLAALHARMSRSSRAVVVTYNPYYGWLYRLASRLGLRKCEAPTTFPTRAALEAIARLVGFEVVRIRPAVYCPFRLLGLGSLINRILPVVPLLRWAGFVSVLTLRPVIASADLPSLGIVIPARNERGNIEAALQRMPAMPGVRRQILFVEGHSQDGTWEEIQRVKAAYADRFDIVVMQQTGKGKYDAVRAGFAAADTDLVTILDADLTMPPELLPRFYEAWVSGACDFVNGSRQVYPMEGEAMRFLNKLGNVFFAKALSFVLATRLSDSLCGTKLMLRSDYRRIERWREDFGDFDPFGDFEMLFAAAVLSLGVLDVPIRYRARTYGSTQISRFRHGWQLLRMTMIGLFRVRTGRIRSPARRQPAA